MTFADGIGTGLQVVGVAVMGLGVWRTWREFALQGESFLEPITTAGREAWAAIASLAAELWRRILRRRRPVVVGAGGAVLHASALNARGRAGFGPLDQSDPTAAALELERRISQVNDRLANLDERIQDEREADLAEVGELRHLVDREVSELRARDRRVALGGLRLEVLGLFLTVLGLVVAASW